MDVKQQNLLEAVGISLFKETKKDFVLNLLKEAWLYFKLILEKHVALMVLALTF